MPLSYVDVLTLAAVARIGELAYGVTIRREIVSCTEKETSMAAVYAALDRLEAEGLVRHRLSEALPERGGRARRHYSLTAAGREILRRERASALRLWQGVPVYGPGSRR